MRACVCACMCVLRCVCVCACVCLGVCVCVHVVRMYKYNVTCTVCIHECSVCRLFHVHDIYVCIYIVCISV